ncbi:hypothetical protein EB796_002442 [Bugula neritina]|uniref:Uncharacterized protein n=1 Tax=Bugula neritina TaxID=10212 RepID=A0A7J7KM73_BUGNE|nr:hypothetical protein EB796_002442 [Bugula neritina]
MAEPSDFKALAGQIGSIVTRLRRNVAKNTTGGTTTGTSVKSTIGYVRWSAQNDEASSDGVPTQEPEISLDPAETEKDCATDSSSRAMTLCTKVSCLILNIRVAVLP